MISCENASFSWDDKGEVAALKELNVSFESGSISMIVGETGSGKSALLQGLLGNLHKESGSIYYERSDLDIGYSSQTAWIQNATIRDNILFGHELDEGFYHDVVSELQTSGAGIYMFDDVPSALIPLNTSDLVATTNTFQLLLVSYLLFEQLYSFSKNTKSMFLT